MPDESLEVLKETDTYYKVKNSNTGEEKTLFKIDMKELERKRIEEDNRIADKLSETDLIVLMKGITDANKPVIDIDDYDKIVRELVETLKTIYSIISQPNFLHSSIKMLSPDMYGRPGSFRENVQILTRSSLGIAKAMKEKGKLTEESEWIQSLV